MIELENVHASKIFKCSAKHLLFVKIAFENGINISPFLFLKHVLLCECLTYDLASLQLLHVNTSRWNDTAPGTGRRSESIVHIESTTTTSLCYWPFCRKGQIGKQLWLLTSEKTDGREAIMQMIKKTHRINQIRTEVVVMATGRNDAGRRFHSGGGGGGVIVVVAGKNGTKTRANPSSFCQRRRRTQYRDAGNENRTKRQNPLKVFHKPNSLQQRKLFRF